MFDKERSGSDRRKAIISITGSARALSGGHGESEGPTGLE
jgi:hypothetical protein